MPPAHGSRKPAASRSAIPGSAARAVAVRLPITLGQFLKVADLASSGGEAKILISDGLVRLNGQTEQRRGHELVPGDVVEVRGTRARVAVTADSTGAAPSGGGPREPGNL
jgi:ribosome-associated protein